MRVHRLPLAVIIAALLPAATGAADIETAATNAQAEARFLSHTRQLIYQGRRSGEGYFSPDGNSLIFQSEREPANPFYQIYILDLESGDTHRVSPGIGKTTCAFFRPGSDEVLFASTHLDPCAVAKQKAELEFRASGKERRYSWDYDEHMDIFVARRDGSNLRRLTSAQGYDAEGSFSPDGKLIVFCSLRAAYPTNKLAPEEQKHLQTDPSWFGDIYLMNADGSNVRRLTHTPGYDGGPFFSPDGQRIIWRRFTERGDTADVYTMKLDGSDERRLTDFGSMSWAPYFHPSGRYVIFTSNKHGFGNFELFLVDANGEREPIRVTYTDGFDGLPVFSPDGKRLAWTSSRTADGKSQIFIADWNDVAAVEALNQADPRASHSQTANQTGSPNFRKQQSNSSLSSSGGENPGEQANERSHTFTPDISTNDLHSIVSYLASDKLEGRLAGSKGAELAADYIAARMKEMGLQPVGTNRDFFQSYEFTAGARVLTNANSMVIKEADGKTASFKVEEDFRPLAFSASAEVEGPVVFAGYGLSAPGKPGEGYDSYAGLDVSNRIAVVLRYVPEEVEPKRRAELNRYAGVRYKAMLAREHGARGVLFVTGPNSPNAGELMPLSSDSSLSGSGIAIVSASSNVVDALFAGSGTSLKELQSGLDKENPHAPGGMVLTNVYVKLKTGIEHIRKTDRNVIGMLPAGTSFDGLEHSRSEKSASSPLLSPPKEQREKAPRNSFQSSDIAGRQNHAVTSGRAEMRSREYLMIGAHYDHLGHGETGAMNRKGEEGLIHPGADDNASGVATILEIAGALAGQRQTNPAAFPRDIIFAAWAGEEIGLIGSAWFAEHPPVPLTNVVAYLNFDMVGRLHDDKLTLQGTGSSPVWPKLIEKRNVAAGFNLILQEDPYLPTDTTSIYPKGIPVLAFFTGSHDDYHRPTDKAETLNYDGAERVAKFAKAMLMDLENTERPAYAQVAGRDSAGGGREALRAYLGTIPDYGTEVKGVKLSGVRAGGPADKAGLRGGDVIVEFGGSRIENIYDYTYAMDAVKIGQPVKVTVLRNGERVTLSVTPEARK